MDANLALGQNCQSGLALAGGEMIRGAGCCCGIGQAWVRRQRNLRDGRRAWRGRTQELAHEDEEQNAPWIKERTLLTVIGTFALARGVRAWLIATCSLFNCDDRFASSETGRLKMALTDRSSHFEFGENWREYAKTIDQTRINLAVEGLRKLFPEGLRGKSFLDIGSGSGLHSLAALMLGATSVVATDIDENSVSTTQELLSKYSPQGSWQAKRASIFDATPEMVGSHDVVYSWGVLHHTGDMWRAIERATTFVKANGQFALAIYAKTPLDWFWKIEKRSYKSSPAPVQWMFRQAFTGSLILAKLARGKSPAEIFRTAQTRGMNYSNDLHDWMGGWPYETATVSELVARISAMGFRELRSFPIADSIGLFGSGCHEVVFMRDELMS